MKSFCLYLNDMQESKIIDLLNPYFATIYEIAIKYDIDFDELVVFALGTAIAKDEDYEYAEDEEYIKLSHEEKKDCVKPFADKKNGNIDYEIFNKQRALHTQEKKKYFALYDSQPLQYF